MMAELTHLEADITQMKEAEAKSQVLFKSLIRAMAPKDALRVSNSIHVISPYFGGISLHFANFAENLPI